MQKLYVLLIVGLFTVVSNAQIGIGTSNPDQSAILEVKGNDGGILIPRMTASQRNNIPISKPGLMVYDLTLQKFMVTSNFNDTMLWAPIGPLWIENANAIYLDSNFIKPLGIGTTDPAPGALVDISGIGGLRIPVMTTTERESIPMETNGLLAWDETMNQLIVTGIYNDSLYCWFTMGPDWIDTPEDIHIDKPVGIGTDEPAPGALLDVKGPGGIKIPDLTTSQRNSLPVEDPGIAVYDKTKDKVMITEVFNDTILWKSLGPNWLENPQAIHTDKPVGVGTSNPIPGALLEVKGQGGMKLPEMDPVDIEQLPKDDPALLLYDEINDQIMTTLGWNETIMWRSLDTYWGHSGQKVFIDSDISAVGIGTQSPAAKLHVDGNVIFEDFAGNGVKPLGVDDNGKIQYWNDTMMVAINSLNFKSNLPITTEFAEEYIAAGLTFEGTGSMWLPLEVDRTGLINDTLFVSYLDASSANLAISLMEVSIDGSGMTTLGSTTTSGNMPGIIQSIGFGFPPNSEIDPFNNHYLLKVTAPNWGVGSLRVVGGVLRCVRQ